MTPRVEAHQLRVVKGAVSAEELAALVVVLNAALKHAADNETEHHLRPEWNAPHRFIRTTLPHGYGAWRRSALPH